jgi:hypothetical protein
MPEFTQAVRDVEEKCAILLASRAHRMCELPEEMPRQGVYIFSKSGRPLYVGRTNTLRKRLQSHTHNNHNQATFAFLLAREQTGNLRATYREKGSRSDLLKQPAFRAAFDDARKTIGQMDVQFVGESDPVRQTLLEVCAAIRVKAKYNDFDNH